MARLIWSPRSISELAAICDYIAADSPEYARLFARRIVEVIERIPDPPKAGRKVPEFGTDTLRERLVGSDRVIYRLAGERIEVVTILHGARLLRAEDI